MAGTYTRATIVILIYYNTVSSLHSGLGHVPLVCTVCSPLYISLQHSLLELQNYFLVLCDIITFQML